MKVHNADKETYHKSVLEYLLLSFQSMAIFSNDCIKQIHMLEELNNKGAKSVEGDNSLV